MTFHAVLKYILGFVEEHTPQSSTRVIAIAFAFTACACGVAAVVFAFMHPGEWQSIAALGGTTVTSLVGGVAYALAVRTRSAPVPPPPPAPPA